MNPKTRGVVYYGVDDKGMYNPDTFNVQERGKTLVLRRDKYAFQGYTKGKSNVGTAMPMHLSGDYSRHVRDNYKSGKKSEKDGMTFVYKSAFGVVHKAKKKKQTLRSMLPDNPYMKPRPAGETAESVRANLNRNAPQGFGQGARTLIADGVAAGRGTQPTGDLRKPPKTPKISTPLWKKPVVFIPAAVAGGAALGAGSYLGREKVKKNAFGVVAKKTKMDAPEGEPKPPKMSRTEKLQREAAGLEDRKGSVKTGYKTQRIVESTPTALIKDTMDIDGIPKSQVKEAKRALMGIRLRRYGPAAGAGVGGLALGAGATGAGLYAANRNKVKKNAFGVDDVEKRSSGAKVMARLASGAARDPRAGAYLSDKVPNVVAGTHVGRGNMALADAKRSAKFNQEFREWRARKGVYAKEGKAFSLSGPSLRDPARRLP